MDVIQKMRLRDNLKKQFDFDEVLWQQYKMAQNECNNLIRQAKRHYFTLNIDAARNDPKKTWKLISELSFRKIRNGCNKALKVTTWLRTVTCPPLLHWLPIMTSSLTILKYNASTVVATIIRHHAKRLFLLRLESDKWRHFLSESGRCFNCLWKSHSAKDCTNTRKCRHCQGKHHQSICPRNQKVEDPKTTKQPKDEERTTTATRICKGTVLLQTARARATNGARSIPVRVLFDTGSQRSYITNSTQAKLKLEPVRKETLYLNTFGDNKCKRQSCEVYKFNIESRNGSEKIELSGINFPIICSPLNSMVNTNYAHLEGLELADFGDDDKDNTIDILIGADHYWDVVTGDVVKGESGPTAVSSKPGWLLSGRIPKSVESQDPTVSNLILAGESYHTSRYFTDTVPKTEDKIVDSLKRFWETESIGIHDCQPGCNDDDKFICDIRFTRNRYEVRLPWKEENPDIGTDYELCYNRLRSLHQRLTKQPDLLREYDKGIQEQLTLGVIERVPDRSEDNNESECNVHYFPHHGVVRKHKSTTKL